MVDETRRRRDSAGNGISVQISRKTLVVIIMAMGLGTAGTGGVALYKASDAQTTAETGKAVVVQAVSQGADTRIENVSRAVVQDSNVDALVRAHNQLVVEVRRLRKICAPRKRTQNVVPLPALPTVELPSDR
mgnify:CR=1 FL=1